MDPAAVRRAVAPVLHDPRLGRRVAVQVTQMSDGGTVYSSGPQRVTPASTMKLLTTTAALQELGADHRFTTRSVARPTGHTVVLVGGGDPLLTRGPDQPGDSYPARADLRTLARSTAVALKQGGRTRVRLGYDTSLFSGPAVDPHWPRSYVAEGVVSPIASLWVDEGRRSPGSPAVYRDPAAAAAAVFAEQLRASGITVTGAPARTASPAGAVELASVSGAPLAQVVQHVLETSDNEGAEVLARQVAVARGLPGSFTGGVSAVREVLTGLGVSSIGDVMYDGSGLSRQDRLRPETLMSVLLTASADRHPALRPVVTGLPVAGFTGSLAYRFSTGDAAGLGRVRAKTGTLTGVHGLAGTLTSRDGAVMAFVAVADRVRPVDTLAARAALDRLAAALAGCRCASSPTAGTSAGPSGGAAGPSDGAGNGPGKVPSGAASGAPTS